MTFEQEQLSELHKALTTIAQGMTSDFPGAPDVMACSRNEFRGEMWSWSQRVAKDALLRYRQALQIVEEEEREEELANGQFGVGA
ncbi:MAG: hypothetical protein QNJ92_06810 [Alphaproteobacteria bacterium]|nr:hypothetical protein [Alphaproteobacteria bacterium]